MAVARGWLELEVCAGRPLALEIVAPLRPSRPFGDRRASRPPCSLAVTPRSRGGLSARDAGRSRARVASGSSLRGDRLASSLELAPCRFEPLKPIPIDRPSGPLAWILRYLTLGPLGPSAGDQVNCGRRR